MGVLVYGKLNYGYLSGIFPNKSLTNPSGVFVWYSAYREFLEYSIIILALLLGTGSALLGVVKRKILLGAGILVIGVIITAFIYALLPRLYFFGDDFSAWLYWPTFGFYAYAGSWVVVTVLGFFLGAIWRAETDMGTK